MLPATLLAAVLTLPLLVPQASASTATSSVTVFLAQCSDGADNDNDGLIDFPDDNNCDSSTGDSESPAPVAPVPGPPLTVVGGSNFRMIPGRPGSEHASSSLPARPFSDASLENLRKIDALLHAVADLNRAELAGPRAGPQSAGQNANVTADGDLFGDEGGNLFRPSPPLLLLGTVVLITAALFLLRLL